MNYADPSQLVDDSTALRTKAYMVFGALAITFSFLVGFGIISSMPLILLSLLVFVYPYLLLRRAGLQSQLAGCWEQAQELAKNSPWQLCQIDGRFWGEHLVLHLRQPATAEVTVSLERTRRASGALEVLGVHKLPLRPDDPSCKGLVHAVETHGSIPVTLRVKNPEPLKSGQTPLVSDCLIVEMA